MKAGLSALAQGKQSMLADQLLFRALRDRLGFTRLRSAATGGAALGLEHLQLQAYGRAAARRTARPNCWAPTRCIPSAMSIPNTTGVAMSGDIEHTASTSATDINGVGEIVVRHPTCTSVITRIGSLGRR